MNQPEPVTDLTTTDEPFSDFDLDIQFTPIDASDTAPAIGGTQNISCGGTCGGSTCSTC
jgi:hypothetical protein